MFRRDAEVRREAERLRLADIVARSRYSEP
jgi:hypothetical protein